MNRERETFKMSSIKNEEVNSLFHGEDLYVNDDYENGEVEYEWCDEEINYVDYGKSYSETTLTFKRCIDNKYFKVDYTCYRDGVYENLNELEAREVFPKQVMTTIYE